MKKNLTDKQKEHIESLGVILEGIGVSPSSARIDALLIVTNSTELTFDEIREDLDLSKSATSNAINYLLKVKRIGYKTKPGDRKRYFYTRLGQWKNILTDHLDKLITYNKVIKEILQERTKETKDFNRQLEDFSNFIDFYQKESVKIIENWNKM